MVTITNAQSFKAEATLPTVKVDGFYQIPLPPQLSTYAAADFSDIRIFDSAGREVPFLLEEERARYHQQEFKSYKILEKRQEPGCCTSLILENTNRQAINNISLEIKNAEVTKNATLLGSDNQQEWYALKQQFTLNTLSNRQRTTEIRIIDFPLSNYQYYALHINDSTTAPLNILSAGFYETTSASGKYTEIPVVVAQADSIKERKTYVTLTLKDAQFVEQFTFRIEGPPFYKRSASLYSSESRTLKNGKSEKWLRYVTTFEIHSTRPVAVQFDGVKSNSFLLIIENENNPSLRIREATAYQLNRYLTTWLIADNQYVLKAGAPTLSSPVYDLAFFRDSIPDQLPVLNLESIKSIDVKDAKATPEFFTSTLFIWAAIVIVILVLGFMTVRMLRESNVPNS